MKENETTLTSRRSAIKSVLASSALLAMGQTFESCHHRLPKNVQRVSLNGKINHSICRWTFQDLSTEELCKVVKMIGINAIDLANPEDWATMQTNNVYSSLCSPGTDIGIPKGWNNPENHARLIARYNETFQAMAKAGYKDLICFSGNRDGMDAETGLKNCLTGLNQILPVAAKFGITLHLELLNSKVDHPDYMADNTKWGVELCKRANSPQLKLLYDIYHMQINEGNVIQTIKENAQWIGHYHTGGVPGRHEIDQTQELCYPAIMKAILATGFRGYVGQEFIPLADDKIASVRNAIAICDVKA